MPDRVAPPVAAELAAGIKAVTYKTIEGVEIAHVGMNWPASTGDVTMTLEHLADAVRAAMEDPLILVPRLKVGHTDATLNEDADVMDPFEYHGELRGDGMPVFGRVDNLRLTNDGGVIVGDYVDMPDWLANAAPSAYPSRSLEGKWDVKTAGGKRYSFVLTAVALLGEPLPAIECLEDLAVMLTRGPAALAEHQAAVKAGRRDMPAPVAAEASTDSVYWQFCGDFAKEGTEYWWWWPVDVRVDPNTVIADDQDGHLYQVPFTTDDDGVATFGEPERVVQQFRVVADPDKEPVAAGRVVARFSGPPKDRVRAATTPKGATMPDKQPTIASDALRERLGLADDATPEQIEEAMLAKLDEGAGDGVGAGDGKPAAAAADPDPKLEPVAATQKGALVEPDALKQLQEDARLGREARETQVTAERESFVDGRVAGGFITPGSRDGHLAELSKGGEIEKAHRQYLTSLTAAIVPVKERGAAPADTNEHEVALSRARTALGLAAA